MSINTQPHSNRRREKYLAPAKIRGMTLIELIVTVAIAAIVVTVAVPSFREMLRKNRVDALTNELASSLNFARSEAVKRGKPITVCKTADPDATPPACSTSAEVGWQSGWLVFVDCSTSWGTCPAGEPQGALNASDILLKVNQPTANTATINANYSSYISYLPSGISNVNGGVANGTFSIVMEDLTRCIKVSTVGRINVSLYAESC